MNETISLEVNLNAYVRRDTARRWIATCPLIGVASQGHSASDAKACLQEAVELWFESCIERGVLDQALREVNFRPSAQKARVDRPREKRPARTNILGEAFAISLTIPGYVATTLLGATA